MGSCFAVFGRPLSRLPPVRELESFHLDQDNTYSAALTALHHLQGSRTSFHWIVKVDALRRDRMPDEKNYQRIFGIVQSSH